MSDFDEISSEPRWYVAHTYSGYENKVKANLEKINIAFRAIEVLFSAEGIEYFSRLPMA